MRTTIVLALLLATGPAFAQAQPFHKEKGQTCPKGYFASGDYCTPFKDSKPAVARPQGASCPSGYYASGGGCVSFH